MYEEGKGVPQDYAAAASWFRKAAEQGNAYAQHFCGLMYARGKGVPNDYAIAASWFRMAAEQENAGSQSSLGLLYAEGLGVPQDHVEAHKWFNLAAANGDDEAAKKRQDIAAKMTPAQIAEAQKRAREWKSKVVK
jgi:TPR repeat protein